LEDLISLASSWPLAPVGIGDVGTRDACVQQKEVMHQHVHPQALRTGPKWGSEEDVGGLLEADGG
jgi:hypothetical protein